MRKIKNRSVWAFALVSTLLAGGAQAADVTLNSSYNESGYTWGTAGETLNITLDSNNKFAGTLTITDGTAKFNSAYKSGTLGSGSKIVLGAGSTLNINGTYLDLVTDISTTGAAKITSSLQNTQNGIYTISSLGGDLTIDTPNRYCITGAVNASGYEIYKTGGNEMVVKANLTNLKALHITAGTWAVEGNVAGYGSGDIYLESGARMKLWGTGRDVTFSTLYHNGGTADWYSDGSGAQKLQGNIVLGVNEATFQVSSTLTFTGSISGEGKTLKHTAYVTKGGNGDGNPQTGHWIFKGKSATEKGITKLANFNLTTQDSEIILGDYSEWNISNAITGSKTGHILTVDANATLNATAISGIKTLTINGTSDVGTITMNQEGGSLTIGKATEVDSLKFTKSTSLVTTATLSTTAETNIPTDVTVTKTGAGTFKLGGSLTGNGNLLIENGTLTQTSGSSKLNGFLGQITIGKDAALDLNGEQAFSCPAILFKDGSTVKTSINRDINWSGVNMKIDPGATVTIGGSVRMAFKVDGGNANGGTLNITNPYAFLNSKLENATVNLTGVLGIEGGTTLSGSTGKELYLNIDGGKLTAWTGTSTYTVNPTSTTVTSKGATINSNGNLILKNPVTLNGTLNLNLPQFTSTNIYLATFQFDGKVSGEQEIVSNGVGITKFNGGADVSKVTLNEGGIVVKGGTFEADSFVINKTYGTQTLSGGSWEQGLIVDGGTLVSPKSFTSTGKTVVMKSGAMTLDGTVKDDASSVWKIDGGTFTLGDGVELNGKIEMASGASLVVGTDSKERAEVSLTSAASVLNGSFLFDVFEDGSSDVLFLGDGTKLGVASVTMNFDEGTNQNELTYVPLFSNGDLTQSVISVTNPGWSSFVEDGALYARNVSSTPEPATWVLLVLGLGFLRFGKRVKYFF